MTHYEIVDYWPGTLNFGSAIRAQDSQTITSGGLLLRWIFNTPLAPNGTGRIVLNGTIR
ncbi:MAG: hypothetical protein WCL18_04580 [bacterium]